jgi:hypothetical protein
MKTGEYPYSRGKHGDTDRLVYSHKRESPNYGNLQSTN